MIEQRMYTTVGHTPEITQLLMNALISYTSLNK